MKLQLPISDVRAVKGKGVPADAVESLLEDGWFFVDGEGAEGHIFGMTVDEVEVKFGFISAEELNRLSHLPNETPLTLWIDGSEWSTNPGMKIYNLKINIPGIENTLCGSWETDV